MANSNATYTTAIAAAFPDDAGGVVTFTQVSDFFIGGSNEIIAGETYSLTLDGSGDGTQLLPVPDNTGTTAANWIVSFVSKAAYIISVAYNASTQQLSDLLAAGQTVTDPDTITAALANKLNNTTDTFTGTMTLDGALNLDGDIDLDTDGGVTFDVSDTGASIVTTKSRLNVNDTAPALWHQDTDDIRHSYEASTNYSRIRAVDINTDIGYEVSVTSSSITIQNTPGTEKILINSSGIAITTANQVNFQDEILQRPVIKDYGETLNAIGSIGGGAQDIDLTLGNVVSGTVDTSTTTFTFSNPPASGTAGSFTLFLTNGGSQTVNWPASVDWAGGTAPTLTSSGVDILTFTTIDGGTIWYGFAAGLDMQ